MEEYFITGITEEQKIRLEERGVVLSKFTLDDREGLLFSPLDENLDKIEEVLGLEVDSVAETNYEGIKEVIMTKVKKGKKEVVVDKWFRDSSSDRFKQITEEVLLPAVKRGVRLICPNGNISEEHLGCSPKRGNSALFRVYIWTTPFVEIRWSGSPHRIWGIPVACSGKWNEPRSMKSDLDEAFLIKDGDYVVARLYKNDLYILHNCAYGDDNSLKIYRRILEEAAVELAMTPAEKKKRAKKLREAKLEQFKENYIQVCANRLKIEIKKLQQSIYEKDALIREQEARLIKRIHKHQDRQRQLLWWNRGEEKVRERLVKEFSKIELLRRELAKLAKGRYPTQKQMQKMCDDYVKEHLSQFTNQLKRLRQSVDESKAEVESMQKKLETTAHHQQEHCERLELISGDNKKEQKRFGDEFDKLRSLPKVVDIEVTREEITVWTEVLFCTDPRTDLVHEIGEFKIAICFGCRPLWFNKSRQVSGYYPGMNGPHIHGNGEACLGNMVDAVAEMVANQEYFVLVTFAIQFVESVNTNDSYGKFIDNWPLKKEEEDNGQ